MNYLTPAETQQTETHVSNSRFVTIVARVDSVEEARSFLAKVREEMSDASHHVYAFRIGFGSSVTEGMSDDGEPSGTAGPPVLAVLRGSDIGDVIVVVTRYFGGTKLGTGGLVRAYGDAARTALNALRTEEKIEKCRVEIEAPYSFYEPITRLIDRYDGTTEKAEFNVKVDLVVSFPVSNLKAFTADLTELTRGRVQPTLLSEGRTQG